MKTLSELINLDESGLVLIREWAAEAKNPVEVLTCDRPDGERALLALQVTTRSPMGALAYETGGLLVDHGWVRVLGAGCPRLPRGIDTWNGLAGGTRKIEGALLVADDAVGGFFALNGDGLPGPAGHVFYHAPDRLAWEDTAKGYSDWLNWLFLGDLEGYYEGMRWSDWRRDASALAGDRGFSIVPPPFTKGGPIEERSRRAVPSQELWHLYAVDLPKQLVGIEDGEVIALCNRT